ncbi:MAG: hypothetical protein ABL999_01795 [Pyrinomonadaceae bacterium]
MELTVNISEKTFSHVSDIARLSERTIDEVLEETFEDSFDEQVAKLKESIKYSSDAEVLELALLKMPADESLRLSELLVKNREGFITSRDKAELDGLMQNNRLNDLRKAIGLVEALERGLIAHI